MKTGTYRALDGRIGRVTYTGTGYLIQWNDGTTTEVSRG